MRKTISAKSDDCYAAVAFSSAGQVCAVTSCGYEFAVKMARYYRQVCKYPRARVLTHEQLVEILDRESTERIRSYSF